MYLPWQFAGLKTSSGNVLKDFVSGDKKFQARVDAFLRRQRWKELPWTLPDYRPLGNTIGELRIDYQKVEHRMYGYFGPGRQFIVLLTGSGKKGQEEKIKAAKKLKKQIDLLPSPPPLETYDV